MKKRWVLLLVLGAFLLGACSSGAQENSADTVNADETGSTTETSTAENALPETTRLMLGTMLLEGNTAVDAAQAQTLLPLWQVYSSLLTSETSAEAEIKGLFKQIQGEMTPEQLAAIESMDLSQENFAQIMADNGFAMGMGGRFGGDNPDAAATMEAMRQSGEAPEGGFPGGQRPEGAGGNFQGGPPVGAEGVPMAGGVNPQDMNPEQLATLQAQRSTRGGGQGGSDTFMVQALIAFLEGKAAG